ncbi:TonB-dependent receptor [Acidovorax sp. YS12]|nr:TonB-dependent receptor [Acidovorax sp. YS12]
MQFDIPRRAADARFARTLAAMGVAQALAACAGAAWAQPAQGPGASTVLDRVVVTADRREEDVQEVNTAITVIGGDAVEQKEVRNAGDVIRFVPNMTADTTDGHGRPKWYIRGIGLSDASLHMTNPVGTYVDDVYVWNASTVGFPLFDLERVEVLRGPQGTLWGKNTTGGAINFISKKPVFKNEGYVKASYARFNESLLEGAYNAVIKEDVLAARISFHRQDADRYTQNSFYPGSTDRYSETALRGQLQANFSDSFDGLLNVHYRKFKGPVLTSGSRANPSNTRWDAPSLAQATDDLEQIGGALTLNKQWGRNTLTSITGIEHFDRAATGGDRVPYESSRSWSDFSVKQFSQELRLASPKEDRLSWIVGGYYFKGKLDSASASAVLPGSVSASGAAKALAYNRGDYTLDADSYALFGSVNYKVNDRFDVTTGVRQTRETKDIDLFYGSAPAGFGFNDPSAGGWYGGGVNRPLTRRAYQNESRAWNDFTWDVTPSYQVNDNLRAYFRFAKGFNGGNFNAGATAQTEVGAINPEYLRSYELGAKSNWLDNRLQVNASVFYYDYTDLQQKAEKVDPATNQIIKTFLNAGSGVVKGAELEVLARPARNLTLGINLGYQHTEFTDFQVTAAKNIAGNWFNRVPRVVSNVFADYRIALASGAAVNLSTDWSYRSKSFFNAEDQTTPDLIEPAYALGNVSVGYTTADGKYHIRGYVLNVTDKVYRNTSLISGSYSYGPPRVFGVSVTAKF